MSTKDPILVINANSVEKDTLAIRAAIARECVGLGPIETVDIPDNPANIATPEDIEIAGRRVAALVESRPDARAFVIACYAQPGLDAARGIATVPVIGIQDGAVETAIGRGGRFGVIALSEGAIVRHLRYLEGKGWTGSLAGEVALERGAADDLFARLVTAGERLKAIGASQVILGCAGLAAHRGPLEAALGVSVIDPTVASVQLAARQLQS